MWKHAGSDADHICSVTYFSLEGKEHVLTYKEPADRFGVESITHLLARLSKSGLKAIEREYFLVQAATEVNGVPTEAEPAAEDGNAIVAEPVVCSAAHTAPVTTLLTRGAVSAIYNLGKPRHPIVQVTDLEILSSGDSTAPKRVRCMLSDGEQWGVGMMTSEMAQMVIAETLKQNGCIKLKNYMVNQIVNTKMCIIVDADVLSEQEEPIGAPVPWTEVGIDLVDLEQHEHILPAREPAPATSTPRTAPPSPDA